MNALFCHSFPPSSRYILSHNPRHRRYSRLNHVYIFENRDYFYRIDIKKAVGLKMYDILQRNDMLGTKSALLYTILLGAQ